jgi:hypothetical protein
MTPYERIITGLSFCDIITSFIYAINPFLVPSGAGINNNVWAFGNLATCQARGFLTQLTIASYWYNCILSYYFLLTVISQVRRKNFVRRCEPLMHLSAIFFPVTAIMGLSRGWYLDYYCWYSDPLVTWIVAGIPVIFTYLSLIINNIAIYAIVRKSLLSSVDSPTSVQQRLKREARTLMFLYVGCFALTISPAFAVQILELYDKRGSNNYHLKVLDRFLLPLQGFFNFFTYTKPMYTRFRATYPNKPMYFVLQQALFNPNVPQMNFSSNQQASPAIAEEDAANPNQALFNSNFRPRSSSSSSSSSSDMPSISNAEGGDGGISNVNIEEDTKEEESDGK